MLPCRLHHVRHPLQHGSRGGVAAVLDTSDGFKGAISAGVEGGISAGVEGGIVYCAVI